MSSDTFQVTREDIRKMESREARKHGGKILADPDVSAPKAINRPYPNRVLTMLT
jgi:hypothetical protein